MADESIFDDYGDASDFEVAVSAVRSPDLPLSQPCSQVLTKYSETHGKSHTKGSQKDDY